MKRMILIFAPLLLFTQCGMRVITAPLFLDNRPGGTPTGKIDTAVLKNYVYDDSLNVEGSHTYHKGKQTISYRGSKGSSYTLTITDNKVEDKIDVIRKSYSIDYIYRVSRNFNKPNIVNTYRYYNDGTLMLKFTERNIQKTIHVGYPHFIKTGLYCAYNEKGELKTSIDYNKEFGFSISDIAKLYKRKMNEHDIAVHQTFIDHPFDPNNPDDVMLKEKYSRYIGFDPKFQYPYWNVTTTETGTSLVIERVLDGNTGKTLSERKRVVGVIAR